MPGNSSKLRGNYAIFLGNRVLQPFHQKKDDDFTLTGSGKGLSAFLSLADAYIAALTKECRCVLVTTDAAFEKVKGLRTVHLKF